MAHICLYTHSELLTRYTQTDKLLGFIYLFINLFTHTHTHTYTHTHTHTHTQISHKRNTRRYIQRRRISLLFMHTPRIYGNSDNRRILEEFAIEENLYTELAAYPK